MRQRWRLGEVLLQNNLVSWENLEKGLQMQRRQERFRGVRKSAVWCLGEILVLQKKISWKQLEDALEIQTKSDGLRLIGQIFVDSKTLSTRELQEALAFQFNMPYVDFSKIVINPTVIQYVPKHIAYDLDVMPLVAKDKSLLIAIPDPLNIEAEQALRKYVGHDCEILYAISSREDIRRALQQYYGGI